MVKGFIIPGAVDAGVNAILNRAWNGLRYEDAPAELKPTILAIAQLKYARSAKRKTTRDQARPPNPGPAAKPAERKAPPVERAAREFA